MQYLHWLLLPVLTWLCWLYMYCEAVEGREKLIVKPGDSGKIQSQFYPKICCTPQIIHIQVLQDPHILVAYVQLSFTDLDLPMNTILRIYRHTIDRKRIMFKEQPEYRYGMWTRPFLVGGNLENITIELKTRPGPVLTTNVGFQVIYRVAHSLLWNSEPTSDLCPYISSALKGGQMVLKANHQHTHADRWIDCVWQITIPHGVPQNVLAYVRFLEADIDGVIEVRNSTSSQGALIAEGSTLQELDTHTSLNGLYVHIFMPAHYIIKSSSVRFVYGLYFQAFNKREECANVGWFFCTLEKWCIPSDNVCNFAQNCPHTEDEIYIDNKCVSAAMDTPSNTGTPTKSPVDCPPGKNRCPDGSCMPFDSPLLCLGSCKIFENKCPDGTCISMNEKCKYYCPSEKKMCPGGRCIWMSDHCEDDPCPDLQTRCQASDVCIFAVDICDGTKDCPVGTDENNCFQFHIGLERRQYLFLLIPAVFLMGMVLLCNYLCQPHRPNRLRERLAQSFGNRRGIRAATNARDDRSHEAFMMLHGPQSVPRQPEEVEEEEEELEPLPPPELCAPPPSYVEVMENDRQKLLQQTEPPTSDQPENPVQPQQQPQPQPQPQPQLQQQDTIQQIVPPPPSYGSLMGESV